MIVLLTSRPDPASVNIRDRLLEHDGWEQGDLFMGRRIHKREPRHDDAPRFILAETPLLHLDADGIDRLLGKAIGEAPEAILVLSKHKAASGKPSLTVHPVGNFGTAEFGGRSGELGIAAPELQSTLLRHIRAESHGTKHDVTFEATHHGPHLSTPCAFVEIGSDAEEWKRDSNGAMMARAILRLQEGPYEAQAGDPRAPPILVGIGGGHYVPRMADLARRGVASFGHIIPNYAIEAGITAAMIEQAAVKTPGVEGYHVDDRNLSAETLAPIREAFTALGLREFTEEMLLTRGTKAPA